MGGGVSGSSNSLELIGSDVLMVDHRREREGGNRTRGRTEMGMEGRRRGRGRRRKKRICKEGNLFVLCSIIEFE